MGRDTGLPEVAVAVATTSGLAVVDAAAGERMALAGLLAVGPCLAAVSGPGGERPRRPAHPHAARSPRPGFPAYAR